MVSLLDDPKINSALRLLNEAAKNRKDDVQELLSNRYSDIRDAVGRASVQAAKQVRRSPWVSIGTAAALFFIVGILMGRSSK